MNSNKKTQRHIPVMPHQPRTNLDPSSNTITVQNMSPSLPRSYQSPGMTFNDIETQQVQQQQQQQQQHAQQQQVQQQQLQRQQQLQQQFQQQQLQQQNHQQQQQQYQQTPVFKSFSFNNNKNDREYSLLYFGNNGISNRVSDSSLTGKDVKSLEEDDSPMLPPKLKLPSIEQSSEDKRTANKDIAIDQMSPYRTSSEQLDPFTTTTATNTNIQNPVNMAGPVNVIPESTANNSLGENLRDAGNFFKRFPSISLINDFNEDIWKRESLSNPNINTKITDLSNSEIVDTLNNFIGFTGNSNSGSVNYPQTSGRQRTPSIFLPPFSRNLNNSSNGSLMFVGQYPANSANPSNIVPVSSRKSSQSIPASTTNTQMHMPWPTDKHSLSASHLQNDSNIKQDITNIHDPSNTSNANDLGLDLATPNELRNDLLLKGLKSESPELSSTQQRSGKRKFRKKSNTQNIGNGHNDNVNIHNLHHGLNTQLHGANGHDNVVENEDDLNDIVLDKGIKLESPASSSNIDLDDPRPIVGATKVDQLMLLIDARKKGVMGNIKQSADGNILPEGEIMPKPEDLVGGVEKNHVKGNKNHECEFCHKRFTQSTHLEVHIRSHMGLKPFKCEYCDKRFTQGGNLRTHMRLHTGEKPFKCNTCGKLFSRKGNLQAHELTHENKKPFVCKFDNCDKTFTQLGNMKAHQNRFHLETLNKLTEKLVHFDQNNINALPDKERMLLEYFSSLYKNLNKGIKGRGKNHK